VGSGRIIQGDAFAELAKMPDQSWDACITDPPEKMSPSIIGELLRVAGRVAIIEPLRSEWQTNPRPVPVCDPPRDQFAYWRVGMLTDLHWGQISFWRCPEIRSGQIVGECYEYDLHMLARHLGHKPPELFEDLLELLQVKSVLDPFAGSGSVCAAAKRRGIDYLGIELEPVNVELCEAVMAGGVA